MSTYKPELSYKNPYWLPKHRTLELQHFCLQYPDWVRSYNELSFKTFPMAKLVRTENTIVDRTAMDAIRMKHYSDKIDLVKNAAIETDEELANYILIGVTEGKSYDYILLHYKIPCCRDVYYNLRRRFFWILSQYRD